MERKYAAHDALTPGPHRTDFQLFLCERGCCASRGARQLSPLGSLEFDEHMTTVATATATKNLPMIPCSEHRGSQESAETVKYHLLYKRENAWERQKTERAILDRLVMNKSCLSKQ